MKFRMGSMHIDAKGHVKANEFPESLMNRSLFGSLTCVEWRWYMELGLLYTRVVYNFNAIFIKIFAESSHCCEEDMFDIFWTVKILSISLSWNILRMTEVIWIFSNKKEKNRTVTEASIQGLFRVLRRYRL